MGLNFITSPTKGLGSSPKLFGASSGGGSYTPPPAPEPDASKFEILDTEEMFGWTIALVRYPACTTYDGKKLLVYESTAEEVRSQTLLDPHFLGQQGVLSPVARFEPTERGRELARIVCIGKVKAR
jgi:hypothetical protein